MPLPEINRAAASSGHAGNSLCSRLPIPFAAPRLVDMLLLPVQLEPSECQRWARAIRCTQVDEAPMARLSLPVGMLDVVITCPDDACFCVT